MRTMTQTGRRVGWVAALSAVVCVMVVGCSTPGERQPGVPTSPPAAAEQVSPGDGAGNDELALAAQGRARALVEAMDAGPPPRRSPRVIWMDTGRPSLQEVTGQESIAAAGSQPDGVSRVDAEVRDARLGESMDGSTRSEGLGVSGGIGDSDPLGEPVEVTRGSTEPESDAVTLLARLREQIRSDQADSAVNRALKGAILAVLDEGRDGGEGFLDELDEGQRRLVQEYAGLLTALQARMVEGMPAEQWRRTEALVRALVGDETLRIGEMKLCTRVEGFGVYDELASRSLLAGREHPMIVYVELEGFESGELLDGRYEVRLTEEVILHSEADDLVVWRQPEYPVVDHSWKRRRDFFLVQLIRLPARLTVGKYLLKVRVTDQANQSVDEAVVRLEVVADRALVSGGGR